MNALILNDPDNKSHTNEKPATQALKLATQALKLATQALHDVCLNDIRMFFSYKLGENTKDHIFTNIFKKTHK
jgi:hypothetical protein